MTNAKPRLSQSIENFFGVLESGRMSESQYLKFKRRIERQVAASMRLAEAVIHTDENFKDACVVLGVDRRANPKLKLVKG